MTTTLRRRVKESGGARRRPDVFLLALLLGLEFRSVGAKDGIGGT